jgi:hypothetical protein
LVVETSSGPGQGLDHGRQRPHHINLMGRTKRARPGRPRKRETPLSRWIDQSGKTRDEIAERLVITRIHLDRLCRADRRPSLELAIEIEKLTDGAVPAEIWTRVPAHSRD